MEFRAAGPVSPSELLARTLAKRVVRSYARRGSAVPREPVGESVSDAEVAAFPVPPGPAAAASFEEIYETHYPRVFLFCLSQVRNRADAEDLAADVFEAAYAAYLAGPPVQAVLAWLLRIARNRVIDARRRAGRRSAILARFYGGLDESDPFAGVEQQVVMRQEAAAALSCARRLGPRDRLIVGLRIMAGLSHAEIALVLGTPERTAVVLSGRALKRLRKLYEEAVA